MRVIEQNEDGRIVIDGEGAEVQIDRAIPGGSPAFLTNFVFNHVEDNPHPGFQIYSLDDPDMKIKKESEIHYESIKSRFEILDL